MTKQQRKLIADIKRFEAAWREAPSPQGQLLYRIGVTSDTTFLDTATEKYGVAFVDQAFVLAKLRDDISKRLGWEIWDGFDDNTTIIEAIAIKQQRGDPFAQWIVSQSQDENSFVHAFRERKIVMPHDRAAVRQHSLTRKQTMKRGNE